MTDEPRRYQRRTRPETAAPGVDDRSWDRASLDALHRIVAASEDTAKATRDTADAVGTIKVIVVILFVLFLVGVFLWVMALSTLAT